MKSVLITFDQAYYERIIACWTVWVVGASPIGACAGTWFEDR